LINDPDLILLDEPTSGLDPIGTSEMKEMIIELKNQGKTVVMCSHLLADVQDVCDRIAILFQGELKVMGSVEELLISQGETQLLTTELNDSTIEEIKEVLARHKAELKSVDHPKATLEDIFLKTVHESIERPGRRYSPSRAKSKKPDKNGDGETTPDKNQ